jgi:hypothetical protein
MIKLSKHIAFLPLLLVISPAYAFNPGEVLIQGGGFIGTSGESQHINIEGLIGNDYTLDNQNSGNGFVGLGYLFHTYKSEKLTFDVGLNAFYFFQTDVKGDIVQEEMFENLSYEYGVTSLPVYVAGKAGFAIVPHQIAFTLDGGLGVNFLTTRNYEEKSLDGMTIPDNMFSGETTSTFSAMAGLGFKFINVGRSPVSLELGYRFFYLGEGELNPKSDAVTDNLYTGSTFANALIFTVSI